MTETVTQTAATLAAPQDPIVTQLNRVQGQLAGIGRMYCDDRTCSDIVHQILAVRSSLGRIAREMLTNEATRCSREKKFEDFDQILKELLR
ncbi:metal-sensitive transcriptional regulator [Candidatus Woesebacteria bacterium]|nr:metal-sensitive transcriptional regulator [Candidatus Woesebacteria bacterium]